MNECSKNVEVEYLGDIAIDTLDALPEFILAERDVFDSTTGNTIRSIVREPSAKLFPNANADNVFALEANNTAIVIPEAQVRAVRVVREVSTDVMQFADATHPASMLAIKRDGDMVHCMSCGVINLPDHEYVIGQDYWVGANGEPVTNDASGCHLFVPVSDSKLVINIYIKD